MSTKSVRVVAGSKDIDARLHIRSMSTSGAFTISNLIVQLDTSPPKHTPRGLPSASNKTGEKVFPAEYALYCLDASSGTSTHEGWVYNITDNSINYKVISEFKFGGSSGYSSSSGSGYGGSSTSSQRSSAPKFYFIVKDGFIDGEKLKEHILQETLTSHYHQSKNKFNLYAANVEVDKSELSGNK